MESISKTLSSRSRNSTESGPYQPMTRFKAGHLLKSGEVHHQKRHQLSSPHRLSSEPKFNVFKNGSNSSQNSKSSSKTHEHQHWTTEQWKKVAWSDESRFLLHHMDGQVCGCWLPGEHMVPGCTMGRRQASGGSVMLWAMFCWETLGPAIHVDVTLIHTTIVADNEHPFMETVFPDGCGLFQQDNTMCHKAKMVQEWFDGHNNKFEVLTWPPNSPDLNPIEYLWDVLDKQVRSMEAPPRNLQDLNDLLLTSWCQISQHTFRSLVESIRQVVGLHDI